MMFLERRARTQSASLLADYPVPVRRLLYWYDGLSDWQRIKYASATSMTIASATMLQVGNQAASVKPAIIETVSEIELTTLSPK